MNPEEFKTLIRIMEEEQRQSPIDALFEGIGWSLGAATGAGLVYLVYLYFFV